MRTPEQTLKAENLVQNLKFPRTFHICNESKKTEDDKVFNKEEMQNFLQLFNSGLGVLTEKIDGSNIGISFDHSGNLQLRHRGGFCSKEEKIYKAAFQWAESKYDHLRYLLNTDAVLFIEWIEFYRDNVLYDHIPSHAFAIALYDASIGPNGTYMSYNYIKDMLSGSGIYMVPQLEITQPIWVPVDLNNLITQSKFSTKHSMEGLVLRIDNGDVNQDIAKFVNDEFRHSVDGSVHWMKKPLVRNPINWELAIQE